MLVAFHSVIGGGNPGLVSQSRDVRRMAGQAGNSIVLVKGETTGSRSLYSKGMKTALCKGVATNTGLGALRLDTSGKERSRHGPG